MHDIADKLPLGRHYRMERFSLCLCALSFVLLLCVGVSFVKDMQKNQVALGETALYTSSVTSTLTESKGKVLGVYTNEDNTRVFVAMKFDDVTSMSTSADNYTMWLTYYSTRGNKMTMDYSTSGSWYVFGSTGVMGAMFVNENGFDEQILDLTVRMNSVLSETTSSSSSSSNVDRSSNSKYDQFDVLFNPGAAKVSHCDALDSDTVSAKELYYDIAGESEEETIKDTLRGDLYTMSLALDLMNEYETRLSTQDSIAVNDRPSDIAGDSITCSSESYSVTTNNGSTSIPKSYEPKFASVPSGGYNIDNWQDTTVLTGNYLKNLLVKDGLASTTSYAAYVKAKSAQATLSNSASTSSKWYYQDGTEFKQGKDSITAGIQTDITNLTSTYSSYRSAKTKYFNTDLASLLELEATLNNLESTTTRNTSDNALQIYG